ncbi:hypothetical protein ACF0H5_008931 [Mactra antiquata]
MSGRKRDFPFSNEDLPYVHSCDSMSAKRACLLNKYNYSQDMNQQFVEKMICEETVMDLNYSGNYVKSDKDKVLQSQDITEVCDINKNTTSNVCIRCQAGEPGHIGHIGR